MSKKKIATLVCGLTLIGALGVGATLAYFTDSATVSNVFTMGNVNAGLFETGIEDDEEVITEKGLVFEDVLPGSDLAKDPTVRIEEGSANCYIRVKYELVAESEEFKGSLGILKEQLDDQIVADNAKWYYNVNDGYFYYSDIMSAGNTATLFDTVTIPSVWGNESANQKFYMNIYAEAIQSDHLADGIIVSSNNKITGWDLGTITIESYNPPTQP